MILHFQLFPIFLTKRIETLLETQVKENLLQNLHLENFILKKFFIKIISVIIFYKIISEIISPIPFQITHQKFKF